MEISRPVALQLVEEHKSGTVLICSDSISVLKSLRSFKYSHQDILFSILQIHSRIVQNNISVSFIWVPAHIENKLAKQALQRENNRNNRDTRSIKQVRN